MEMKLVTRLKTWWRLRGATAAPIGTLAVPVGQHKMLTDEEKWKREHGFSAATAPLPATAEIAAHNMEIDQEYYAEIDRRKALFEAGEYRPRFMCVRPGHEVPPGLVGHANEVAAWVLANPGAVDINWDLEMTLDAGRRHDVTSESGKPVLPMPTSEDVRQVAELREAQDAVSRAEAANIARDLGGLTPSVVMRRLGLTDEAIRAACGDDDVLFAKLKARAEEVGQELSDIARTVA